jgi:hypothetical protein
MKLLFRFAAVAALSLLTGCGELGSESDAAQEEQLNRAMTVPGMPPQDSLGNPEEASGKRVPGE